MLPSRILHQFFIAVYSILWKWPQIVFRLKRTGFISRTLVECLIIKTIACTDIHTVEGPGICFRCNLPPTGIEIAVSFKSQFYPALVMDRLTHLILRKVGWKVWQAR